MDAKWIRASELYAQGFPKGVIERIWNTPNQNVVFKIDPIKGKSPFYVDYEALKKWLAKENRHEEAKRCLVN